MANMSLYITHVDDSPRRRKEPFVCFWGVPQNRFRILIELFIETIQHSLETRPPPLYLKELDINQICCVFINNQWQRARITHVKLSENGTLDVFCIDTGKLHKIPPNFVRILNYPGNEEENLRTWAPLASKFLLADITAPRESFSSSHQWSEAAMMFFKMHVEKQIWKAILIENYKEGQSVRLFGSNNQLLATIMIERKMGVAVQTYIEYMQSYTSVVVKTKDPHHTHVIASPNVNTTGDNVKKLTSNTTTDDSCNKLENINITIPTCVFEIPAAKLANKQHLYITHTEKPGYFFGQFQKMFQDLYQMTKELDKLYSSVPYPPLLYADVKSHLLEYGVLKWDEFHVYRVRITKEFVNHAEVMFVDFGSTVMISRSKILAPLQSSTLFRQPPFGVHCQLENDVTMSIPEWRDLIVGKFLKVKVGTCVDGVYSVKFTNDPCNDKIAKILSPAVLSESKDLKSEPKMGKECYLQTSVPSSGRLRTIDRSMRNQENSISVTVFWGSRSDVGRLEEVDLPKISKTRTYSCHPMSYPVQPVPLNQPVKVVYVNNPSSFYVLQLESWTALGELEKNLNEVYSDESKPSIEEPKPGSACVVQYEEDNGWYRGQIVKYCAHQGATVLFVDCGNTQLAPVEKIKSIDEELVKLPPLAYHCKLDEEDASRDWTVEEKDKFQSRTMGKIFSATFTILDSEGKYLVRLVEETKKEKIVVKDNLGAPSFPNILPPSAGYSSRSVSDKPISVVVSYFVHPFRFFLSSPVICAYQNELEELEKFYSSLSPNDLHEDQPSLGLPCVARFAEDGRYYRSQILSIVDDNADILFVDYGNQQKTPLSELKRITPCFMEFPQMTWQCKLKGVKKASPICPDFQKHIDTCFATNEELSALFHPASPGENNGVFEVDLTVPKIGDASQYLIEKNVVERVSLEADVELAAQDVNFSPQQIISTNAITLCFKSPAEFWVQFDPSSVNDFMARLDKLALDPQFLNKKDFIPSVGKPCLAFYEVDNRWYRAKVEAVKEDCVTIFYVDYGNSCDVKTCDLRGLPKEFAQQPALALKCCQDGSENFSETASKLFEEIVMDLESFSVKFLKLVDGVLCVRLSRGESDLGELCSPFETEPLPEEPIISGAVVQAESLVQDVAVTNNLAVNDVFGTLLLFSEFTSLPVSETPMEVYVSWFYNPGQFFLSPVNLSKYQNCLEELEKFYSSLSPEELMEEQPSLELPCVARFTEDDRFYRSEILTIRGEIAELLFVDFGNKQTTPLSQVKRMVPRFLGFPKLAWNCKLEGVKKMTTFSINPEAKKYLAACFLTGETVTATFHSTGSDGNNGFFEVDLAVPEIGDVSQYLIRNNILERISHPKLPAQNLEFVSNQIISTHAVASYIKSPTEFWVQLDPVSLELIADLIDKLVLDPAFTNENNFTVFKGKPCLAFFPDDQRWYRATVEAVNGDTAHVFYFDYGNNCAVKMSDLRQLPVELSKQAALAFKCSLDGSKGFSKDAIAAFETLMFGLPAFIIECLDVIDEVLRVRLYSSSGINLIKQLSSGKLSLPPIPEEESVESIPEVVFTELEGKISYYSSNIFWFHLERNKVEMKEMEDQLNQLCKRDANFFSDKHKPKNNLIYGIKHPKFAAWRRGLLYKIFTNTASVYFLDYGDSQVVSFAEIFALPDQFQRIPPFAIRCRVKTSWKPIELTPAVLEKLNGVCFYPETPCKLVCGRRENDKVSFIDSFFVGEHEIIELLCTGLTKKECGYSVTLEQCINLMSQKGWKGGDWCSGLRSSSVIQFVDLLGR